MSEHDALSARMSAYAFLASLVLANIRQMRRTEIVLDADDRLQFERLRDVLLASWRGAELSGNLNRSADAIGDLTPEPRAAVSTISEQLQAYRLVKRLAPSDFEEFVPRAAEVLDRLHEENRAPWQALEETDKAFVSNELDEFLGRLTRGAELVSEPFAGLHSTLV